MLALKLPTLQRVEAVRCDEYWIGNVEPCGEDWTFSVIGPDEEIETFVHASQHAAECARAAMFRTLGPAVSVVYRGAQG